MLLSSYNTGHVDPQVAAAVGDHCFIDDDPQSQQQQDQMLVNQSGLGNCSMQPGQDHLGNLQQNHLKGSSELLSPGAAQQQQQQQQPRALRIKPQPNQVLKCPRCNSLNTKFCYYNNYSLTQPRHFCKNCRRYWTKGGALRNVPVGGGCRKNKRTKQHKSSSSSDMNASDSKSDLSGGSRGPPILTGSTSGLFDLGKDHHPGDEGIPGLPSFARIPHSLRLGDHSAPGSSSGGLSFEIPRSFSSCLPMSLPGFDQGGAPGATLSFQGLMKHENPGGGEFNPSLYDPTSLNLLGAAGAPPSSEGFSIGLENFVGLGLGGDLKAWRQQQQQKIQASLEDEQGVGIHHQGLLHLKSGKDPEWQGESQQQQQQNPGQNQEVAFLEPAGDGGTGTGAAAGYWSSSGWAMDLPIYVDHHQFCDVKPVDHSQQAAAVVPDFYSSRGRCAPSLT